MGYGDLAAHSGYQLRQSTNAPHRGSHEIGESVIWGRMLPPVPGCPA